MMGIGLALVSKGDIVRHKYPRGVYGGSKMEEDKNLNCERHRHSPRSEEELKSLQNRIARIQGQLSGISKMLDDNRYCGDVLTQLVAVQSALQSLGYLVLASHMNSCVKDDILAGKDEVIDETMDLIKKLK